MSKETENYIKVMGQEEELTRIIESSQTAERRNNARLKLLKAHQSAKENRDLESIIDLEMTAIQGELTHYSNGDEMQKSLAKAVNDLMIIKEHFEIVADVSRYEEVNKQYPRSEERKPKALPIDSARRAFASHTARLTNMKKTRSSRLQKDMIEQRKQAFSVAHKRYQERQAEALGVEANKPQKIPSSDSNSEK